MANLTLLLFLSCAFIPWAQAQDADKSSVTTQDTNMDRQHDDGYEPATIENLSKAYWGIGKFSLDDNDAIDGFLAINECRIYREYRYDDFAWADIRRSIRRYIEQSAGTFPTHISFIVPIKFQEYSHEKQSFIVEKESELDRIRHFVIFSPDQEDICGRDEILGYPGALILNVKRPLYMREIRVPPDIAQEYLNYLKEKGELGKTRQAYMRVKISLLRYWETRQSSETGMMASVLGAIDGIEIYGDPDTTMLLYRKDFQEKQAPLPSSSKKGREQP